ncbi:MAG: hypothetical protein ACFFG0_01720 [Candidatus Thorarchaeota archaeon]
MSLLNPCRKCLVKPCCTQECGYLKEWQKKIYILLETHDVFILLFGIIIMTLLLVLNGLKLISEDRAIVIFNKTEKFIERKVKIRIK